MLLLGLGLLAPPGAEGTCSHLVVSRSESERLSSLIAPLVRDLAGDSDGLPIPLPPRPCSGALCSGQPAEPAVPAGFFDARLDTWAWYAAVPSLALIGDSFLVMSTHELHPIRQSLDVFHPPRPIRSA